MSDRTKLTLASLAIMMLPYRIARMQLSRNFIAALSLYQSPKSRSMI